MPQVQFTEARVRNLKQQPTTTWYSHKGDAYPGLHLAVGKTTKTWFLKKHNPLTGKTKTLNLGRFPAMSLKQAADTAKTRAAAIHNGTQIETRTMVTFRDAFEEHINRKTRSGKLKEASAQDYRSVMKNFDDFMPRRLETITHDELQTFLLKLSPAIARYCRAVISACYRTARKQRPELYNPAKGIDLPAAKKREPILKASGVSDLSAIWNAVWEIKSDPTRMGWLVAMFTGTRNRSIVTLRWSPDPNREIGHVDLKRKVIHLPRMKNYEARDIPISDIVFAVLKRQKGKHPVHVFPSDVRDGPIYILPSLKGIARVHDTRHHFTTACAACRLPSYIIEYLRGDKLNADRADMVSHYLGSVGEHEDSNRIAAHLLGQFGTTPDSALERIEHGT